MKINHFAFRVMLIILLFFSILLFASCSVISGGSQGGVGKISVTSPEEGRNTVLNNINERYDLGLPTNAQDWNKKDITPADVTTTKAYEYKFIDWIATVIFRVTDPAETVYRIIIANSQNFNWQGEVDAYGNISESSIELGSGVGVPGLPSTNTPIPTGTPTNTPQLSKVSASYKDETYRLTFQYPNSWILTVVSAGRYTGTGFSSKSVELSKDRMKTVVQYKTPWEITELETGKPAGVVEIRKIITLFGQDVPLEYVVNSGEVKYISLDADFPDLNIHLHVETEESSIPQWAQDDFEQMVASFDRTGGPLPSPTLSSTPSPATLTATALYGTIISGGTGSGTGTGSGSGTSATSTPGAGCNKANFVAHVTIPEGTILPAGSDFTKVWRIENVGSCTWTTSYSLVFSDGDQMGAPDSVKLSESVAPNSTIDISVDMTAPSSPGQYQGNWVLSDANGNKFGLGEQKTGKIPVIINVLGLGTETEVAYDFATNYCDAVWKNNDDVTLPCPGSILSSDGFVVLINNPELETGTEDEPTLWVHPKDEVNGWIQGTYPEFTVRLRDVFLASVSCAIPNCNLHFYLDYLDGDGVQHTLADWEETYDENVTTIEVRLLPLVAQTVQFILKTEIISNPGLAAQGFWVSPVIERAALPFDFGGD